MIVMCKARASFDSYTNTVPSAQPDLLEKDAKYYVHAIGGNCFGMWYYVCMWNGAAFPYPFSADLFEVVEDDVSDFTEKQVVSKQKDEWIMAPGFWTKKPNYYEILIDAVPGEFSVEREAFVGFVKKIRSRGYPSVDCIV